MRAITFASIALGAGLAAAQSNSTGADGLPIVDLGYTLHQANFFNSTGNFYNFSNIRYAAPPLGELRWAPPQAPQSNRSQVDDGSQGRMCPQASPAWDNIAGQFLGEYLQGQPTNITTPSGPQTITIDPRTTEDCLFLDVVVPKNILDNAGPSCNTSGAPVLVWIYGGGYTEGDKTNDGPAGLIERSKDGIIFVALNYRLGAFGWLSGPTFQANGTANLGLWDQRFALQWVQENIYLFGGDPNRVTIIGESAGGGSIMHQITAFGGKYPVPFQQAIPQSPGFQPIATNFFQETAYQGYLSLLNVTTLEEARNLSTNDLITANIKQVGSSPYGSFTFGPTVDGDFVPALPGLLLLHGQYDKNVSLMLGHNADEGLLFTSPFVTNDSSFRADLQGVFPDISTASLEFIDTELYPASAFNDTTSRLATATAEVVFECNTFYLDNAFGNKTYSYFFTVPPAIHGEDVAYTFYNDEGAVSIQNAFANGGIANTTVALALQDFIVTFTETGVPSTPDLPAGAVPNFIMYGENATVVNLGIQGIDLQRDDAANARCNWWQKALYY